MHRSLVLLAAVVFAATLSAAAVKLPAADEQWITFEVDGYRFISNASPRVTQAAARDLLRMRAAVGQVTRLRVRTLVPTRFFLFSSTQSFDPYRDAVLGMKDGELEGGEIGGLFLHGRGGDFVIMRSDSIDGSRGVFHELTHQFLANTAQNVPSWFNEGMAEYYSTFRTESDMAHVGRPVGDHVLLLRDQPLIPLRELFAVTSPLHEGARMGPFYAQSWALVHYLLVDPGRRAKLARFIGLLDSGKSIDEAFSGAFGMQVSELEEALRAYVQRVSFDYYAYPLGELAIPELPEPVAMPRDAVLQQLGQLLVATNPATAPSAKRFFEEALAANPKNALAYNGLGRVYDAAGRAADADAAYAKAVQLGSEDAEVHLAVGWSLWARPRNPDSYGRVRALFQRATKIDPKSSRVWAALGSLYLENERERAAAIAAFEKSLELEPANDAVAFQLSRLLAREGRNDEVRKLEAARLARTPAPVRGTLMAAEVDRFETATDFSASLHEAMAKVDARKYDEALAILDRLLPTIWDPAIEEQTRAFREQVAAMKAKKK